VWIEPQAVEDPEGVAADAPRSGLPDRHEDVKGASGVTESEVVVEHRYGPGAAATVVDSDGRRRSTATLSDWEAEDRVQTERAGGKSGPP
jgi:hypothetical protein